MKAMCPLGCYHTGFDNYYKLALRDHVRWPKFCGKYEKACGKYKTCGKYEKAYIKRRAIYLAIILTIFCKFSLI